MLWKVPSWSASDFSCVYYSTYAGRMVLFFGCGLARAMDSQDRAIVLLVGLPQINHTLRLNAHEALRQRIVMNYNMEGLSKAEGRIYISEKLRHAGSTFPVFDDSAIEAILNKANGIPRVMNRLCSSSLLIADSLGKKVVSLDVVTSAIDDRSFD